MSAETLISDFPIACLFAGLLAVGAFLALLAREFQMAHLFALTLGAFLALLACCRIAELEKAAGQPTPAPSVKGMALEASGASGGSGWGQAGED